MKRLVVYLLVALAGLLTGGVVGAVVGRRMCDRVIGHWYVTDLMDQAYAAREIYAGRSRELADSLRTRLPEYVLGVEKEFRGDETRNTAFRVVGEVYAASNTEVPFEIRSILASVPPGPSRRVPASGARK